MKPKLKDLIGRAGYKCPYCKSSQTYQHRFGKFYCAKCNRLFR